MGSWPGVTAEYGKLRMKIKAAGVIAEETDAAPGTILAADKKGLKVACGEGILLITELQMPGKRAMTAEDYLKGNKIETGIILK